MDLKERYLTLLKSIGEILKNENQMHISSIKKKMDTILEDCIKLENEISKEKEWEVGGSGLTEEDKQEINNSLLELKSKIDNQDKKIDENSSQIDENMNLLNSRMDTFTKLEEGSTTADAELKDIRVGADGTTYENAGTAVREQFNELKEDLDYVYNKDECKELIKSDNLTSGGYTTGTFTQSENVFSCETNSNISINFNAYGKKILVFWKVSKASYRNIRFTKVNGTQNATPVTYRKADEYEKAVLEAPKDFPYICLTGNSGNDTTVYMFDVSNLTDEQIDSITAEMAENDAVVFEYGEIIRIAEKLPDKAEFEEQTTSNMFSEWENGYIDGLGNLSANTSYYCSKQINVDGQKTVSVFGLNAESSALHCACYGESGNYLGREMNTQGNGYPSFMLITRPETKSIRVFWRVLQTIDISKVAIYLGTSASLIGYTEHTKKTLLKENVYYSDIPKYALKTGWTEKKLYY